MVLSPAWVRRMASCQMASWAGPGAVVSIRCRTSAASMGESWKRTIVCWLVVVQSWLRVSMMVGVTVMLMVFVVPGGRGCVPSFSRRQKRVWIFAWVQGGASLDTALGSVSVAPCQCGF